MAIIREFLTLYVSYNIDFDYNNDDTKYFFKFITFQKKTY